jgi:hypothetical protein
LSPRPQESEREDVSLSQHVATIFAENNVLRNVETRIAQLLVPNREQTAAPRLASDAPTANGSPGFV